MPRTRARSADVVKGELFEIPDAERDAVLDRLDRYEGDAFERVERPVVTAAGEEHTAFVFVVKGSTAGARRIPSGDYVEDLRSRDPAAPRD